MVAKGHTPHKTLGVLVVDDSVDDLFFIERGLSHSACLRIVGVARDGSEALCYLQGLGIYADRTQHPYPDVVLLDLKMPRQDGFDVLTWIRKENLPLKVIVLSSSAEPRDKERAMMLRADGYLIKPVAHEEWFQVIHSVDHTLCV